MKLKIFCDGASRGNPGFSAIAFMILGEDGEVLKTYSKYVGVRTNNQAEYEALISALESASKLSSQEVDCYMDSELVVKHLNGEYRIRNPKLRPLWSKVQDLRKRFKKTTFTHAPRKNNHIQEVDRLANQALDEALC